METATTRHILLQLKVAQAKDLHNLDNTMKVGVMYFEQLANGVIYPKAKYLSPNTNMPEFRKMFAHKQIWVLKSADAFEYVEFDKNDNRVKTENQSI